MGTFQIVALLLHVGGVFTAHGRPHGWCPHQPVTIWNAPKVIIKSTYF